MKCILRIVPTLLLIGAVNAANTVSANPTNESSAIAVGENEFNAVSAQESAEISRSKLSKTISIPTFQIDGTLLEIAEENLNTERPIRQLSYVNMLVVRRQFQDDFFKLNEFYEIVTQALLNNPNATIVVREGGTESWGFVVPKPNTEKAKLAWELTEQRVRDIFVSSASIYKVPPDLLAADIERMRQVVFIRDPLGFVAMKRGELLKGRSIVAIDQGDVDGSFQQAQKDGAEFSVLINDLVRKYGVKVDQVTFFSDVFSKNRTEAEIDRKSEEYKDKVAALREAINQHPQVPNAMKNRIMILLDSYPNIAKQLLIFPREAAKSSGELIAKLGQDIILIAARPFIDLLIEMGYIKH